MVERELQDWEFPEPDDEDDGTETWPCNECGAVIYEEAEQCPVCGAYVVHHSRVLTGRPWWYVLLAVTGVAATVIWLML